MFQLTSKRQIKTIKPRPCFLCTQEIEAKTQAVELKGNWDFKRVRYLIHLECNRKAVKEKLYETGLKEGIYQDLATNVIHIFDDNESEQKKKINALKEIAAMQRLNVHYYKKKLEADPDNEKLKNVLNDAEVEATEILEEINELERVLC